MENLNAEQIIKALECCASPEYRCEECPIDQKKKDDCVCGQFLAQNALALITSQEQRIAELTQANEMLSESYDHLEKTKDELIAERSRLTEENVRLRVVADMSDTTLTDALRIVNEFCDSRIKRAKADTVRKMQERLKEHLDDFYNSGEDALLDVPDLIDQIAKELLEGI